GDGCPDPDGNFDGGDLLVTQFEFILSPTTATANGAFVDKNMDSCSFAGAGLNNTKRCSNDNGKPCTSNGDCGGANTCQNGPLVGTPAAGPCCVVGQTMRFVATSPV